MMVIIVVVMMTMTDIIMIDSLSAYRMSFISHFSISTSHAVEAYECKYRDYELR